MTPPGRSCVTNTLDGAAGFPVVKRPGYQRRHLFLVRVAEPREGARIDDLALVADHLEIQDVLAEFFPTSLRSSACPELVEGHAAWTRA